MVEALCLLLLTSCLHVVEEGADETPRTVAEVQVAPEGPAREAEAPAPTRPNADPAKPR